MCTVFVFENVEGQKFLASSVVLSYFKQILTSGMYSQFHCPTDSGQSLSVEALGMGGQRQRRGAAERQQQGAGRGRRATKSSRY